MYARLQLSLFQWLYAYTCACIFIMVPVLLVCEYKTQCPLFNTFLTPVDPGGATAVGIYLIYTAEFTPIARVTLCLSKERSMVCCWRSVLNIFMADNARKHILKVVRRKQYTATATMTVTVCQKPLMYCGVISKGYVCLPCF